MISSEAMGRKRSDRGIAVISAGPLESLVGPHVAIEVAILAPRLLEVPISSGFVSPHVGIHTSRHGSPIFCR